MMEITAEELEVIHRDIKNSKRAEIALDVLDDVLKKIIEQAKNDFSTISLANYQKIDNNEIYVLLSRINMAKEIGIEIRKMIDAGGRAKFRLEIGD